MTLRANGPAIRAIRERTGISLSALALCAGINKGQLSRIEREHSETSAPVLRALADRLGVPLEAITHRAAEPQPEAVNQ